MNYNIIIKIVPAIKELAGTIFEVRHYFFIMLKYLNYIFPCLGNNKKLIYDQKCTIIMMGGL